MFSEAWLRAVDSPSPVPPTLVDMVCTSGKAQHDLLDLAHLGVAALQARAHRQRAPQLREALVGLRHELAAHQRRQRQRADEAAASADAEA